MAKVYTLVWVYYRGRIEHTGTIEELTEWASFDLLCGNSRDARINRHPRTAKALENALNKSAQVCHRYNDYYFIKSKED